MHHSPTLTHRPGLCMLGILLLLMSVSAGTARETIDLYPDEVPNAKIQEAPAGDGAVVDGMVRRVVRPSMEVYLPEKGKASGAAVVICPGGGYSVIVFEGEGVATAKAFAERGIAAFVLKYRLPDDALMMDKSIGPLQDAQQAIKLVRESAEQWGLNKNRIGIMGFSAGGHLASTAATHYRKVLVPNENNTSVRPDFQILVYPVISMQDNLTHMGSRNNLLGEEPSAETIELYSNELQVDENTPPAYLTHAGDDGTVDVDNCINYFEQLRHHKVAAELHIYQKGGHGFVFNHPGWMDPLSQWMKESEWID